MDRVTAWRRPPRRVAAASAAVAVMIAVLAGQLVDGGNVTVSAFGLSVGIAVPFTVLGLLVLHSAPGHAVGRVMTAAGLTAAVNVLALSWSSWTPMAWLAQWSWWPAVGLIFLAVLLFPDGRLPSPRWRVVAAAIATGTVVAAALFAVVAADQPRFLTDPTTRVDPWAQTLLEVGAGAVLLAMAGYVGALVALGSRWRRADTDTRRQLMCLLLAGTVFLGGIALDATPLQGGWTFAVIAVPLGMAVAILRYHLYDVDVCVNRTIVWLLMTGLVIIGFVGLLFLLGHSLFTGQPTRAAIVATGAAVVTFEPLHRRIQHGVNRLLYGDRDEPYVVVARLGEVLGRTVDPGAVMPLVTGTIARSLQVPYVAVELEERDGPVLVAEHGRAATMTESFDMVSHGSRIGRLLVARRSPSERFSQHEQRLLRNIALQAAVAAEATRLNRDLQASRERLVTAREEERRRLRRDLHDGIGPSLAGMSMQVRAALRLLPGESRAARILEALATDLRACTVEVRQLVDELRPPALDRGLHAAVRAECQRFDTETLSVRCEVHGILEGLPAAVEVAAFRIVAESLTNVARHSRAGTCRVALRRDLTLTVEIVDDGVGIDAPAGSGVGLTSMRERAAELGGDCVVTTAPGGGTAVRLELPLEAATAATAATVPTDVPARPATVVPLTDAATRNGRP